MKQLSLPISEELSEYCEFLSLHAMKKHEFLISEYNSEIYHFLELF